MSSSSCSSHFYRKVERRCCTTPHCCLCCCGRRKHKITESNYIDSRHRPQVRPCITLVRYRQCDFAVSTFIHPSHFLLFVSWNLEKLTRRNLSLISFIFFFFVTKVSWKSIRHEMFEVDTGLLFSSSFSSLIIPRLCFHMVRGETSNPDRFTSSSRLRWAFQFFVLFPSFSRCATSQPAAQQSAL